MRGIQTPLRCFFFFPVKDLEDSVGYNGTPPGGVLELGHSSRFLEQIRRSATPNECEASSGAALAPGPVDVEGRCKVLLLGRDELMQPRHAKSVNAPPWQHVEGLCLDQWARWCHV